MSKNKVAVITGATKGIGRAIALHFAAQGFNLALNARNEQDLIQLTASLSVQFPDIEVLVVPTDMSDKTSIEDFARAVLDAFPQIDVLVNNAGVFLQTAAGRDADEEAFRCMMDTNLYSAFYLTRALLPAMPKHSKSHVFNMCSIASIMPYGAYSVSKYALLGYSKVLREELKTDGIRVTAVLPGATLTASWDGVELPEERFMPAEDIAEAVWAVYQLTDRTVVEELVLRPQLGDI
jgi:short-subunit dehydrogenase